MNADVFIRQVADATIQAATLFQQSGNPLTTTALDAIVTEVVKRLMDAGQSGSEISPTKSDAASTHSDKELRRVIREELARLREDGNPQFNGEGTAEPLMRATKPAQGDESVYERKYRSSRAKDEAFPTAAPVQAGEGDRFGYKAAASQAADAAREAARRRAKGEHERDVNYRVKYGTMTQDEADGKLRAALEAIDGTPSEKAKRDTADLYGMIYAQKRGKKKRAATDADPIDTTGVSLVKGGEMALQLRTAAV